MNGINFHHKFSYFSNNNTSNSINLKEDYHMNTKGLDYTALTIVIIGAINWGLIGFFDFNLVSFLFGSATMLSRIIYGIVGVCGVYLISVYGRIAEMGRGID
jgi:uncharacterized membrane protein YuzA (DUF378 family)